MPANTARQEKTGKILAIFLFIFIFFVIFLAAALKQTLDNANAIKLKRLENVSSFRGSVKTYDGASLARSVDTYYLAINGQNYKAKNYPFLAEILSIYTGENKAQILRALRQKKRVIIKDDIQIKDAKALMNLSKTLDAMGFFVAFIHQNSARRYGLEVIKNDTLQRKYEYKDLLTPVLGFTRKIDGGAVTGLEKFYDDDLREKEKGWIYAYKDVLGNIIYNNKLEFQPGGDGNSIILNINSRLQKSLEEILDAQKKMYDAAEVIAAVMESKTGKILAIAGTERYDPAQIKNISHTRLAHIQYNFEPGSVIKPLILAKAMELKKIKPHDLLPAYKGRWQLRNKLITDEKTGLDFISAANTIVFSSNIGIAQIALKLSGKNIVELFSDFGFAGHSDIDLPYERQTLIPSEKTYDNSDIYKATTAYGYGFQTNFIKLLKAYNVFNNGGLLLTPSLAKTLITAKSEILHSSHAPQRALSSAVANSMLCILRDTVLKGTAQKAQTDGIFVAGKTGTAHIAKDGGYSNTYNSSFFGFANDYSRRYTIGITFIEPKTAHYSSQIAVPAAREIIGALIEKDFLRPSSVKLNYCKE
ncbi:MAG: peptidoglycan D,D-transpeptidase FtsI family protein [Helicobacteraceae bacterium]